MRVLAVVGLVLFLLAQPAVSQVPDDKFVVPGVRIGKWTLDMTAAMILGCIGGPTFSSRQPRAGETHSGWSMSSHRVVHLGRTRTSLRGQPAKPWRVLTDSPP